jgi:murein L,D-transpeptidase YcbB/YkuD
VNRVRRQASAKKVPSMSMAVGLLVGLAALAAPLRAQEADVAVIRGLAAAARVPGARWPDFPRYVDDVARLYGIHGHAPIWFGDGHLTTAGRAAVDALLAADSHGLDPDDYDAPTFDSLVREWDGGAPPSAAERGRLDLLLTVDLIRYLDDLRHGRTKGTGRSGSVAREPPPDWARVIDRAMAVDSVAALAGEAAPALTQYQNLRRLLAEYRQFATEVEFVPLAFGTAMEPGAVSTSLPELRNRLRLLGDLPQGSTPDDETVYAGAVVAAVRSFQGRHGLDDDGIVGPVTVAALNVSPARRLRQIELALERLRWLPALGRQPFVVVNIPAFHLFGFDSAGGTGAPSFDSRVVVGRALDTRTPVLYELMRYVEFRPYWNVPRSILVKEILPRLRRDPGYLRVHRMEIVGPAERSLGDDVTDDLRRRLVRGELRVRQRPGPSNALGFVKFVFPNAENVYLHATPDTTLFERSRRDFSHGCIRVQDAGGLATWVLRGLPGWGRDQVARALDGPATRRALLARPLPVAILYTTAVATPSGAPWFFEDIYGLDLELDEALRAGPTPP